MDFEGLTKGNVLALELYHRMLKDDSFGPPQEIKRLEEENRKLQESVRMLEAQVTTPITCHVTALTTPIILHVIHSS